MRTFLTLALILVYSYTAYSQDFYLAPNGVTCMCPNAAVGASGDPGNGIVYTKRTRSEITTQNAATTCTSGITDMSLLFNGQSQFNEDISTWDVSNVVSMQGMFVDCVSFNQDLSYWDVSNVTSMEAMFFDADSFNNDIGNWNVSNVSNFGEMFSQTDSFNQPSINFWDTSSATSIRYMFAGAVFNSDLNNWDTSNILEMDGVFSFNSQFNSDISSWDVSSVTNMEEMFFGNLVFNQNISNWNISSVENMIGMFRNSAFNQPLYTWNFNSLVNLVGFLGNSAYDLENYDTLLSSFVDQNLQGLELGAEGLYYCNMVDHSELLSRGWIITGDNVLNPSMSPIDDIQIALQIGCAASNVDLGEPLIEGCGPLSLSNDAPTEFPLGITHVTWSLIDGNGNSNQQIQLVEVVLISDRAVICYVSADENSPSNNRIFITSDPALNGQNVDFHEVLRESPSGAYETIGFIVPPEDSFLDVTSDNNTQAYRYKVQTTDVCGQVLTISNFHKTILLQSSIATDNSVNLAWNPYIGVAFNTYNIYRSVNGGNYELLNSVSSTNTSYNDTSANVVDNFYEYYISIDVASCSTDPFQSFELESNREYINPNLSIGENNWLEKAISLYPNPATELINISASEGVEVRSLILYSALGQRIMSVEELTSIDVSMLPSGVYYMTIETDQGGINKTLIRK